MGDFTGRINDSLLKDRRPIRIDSNNFNDVLKEQNISLDISVEDKLSWKTDNELPLKFTIETIKDFEPTDATPRALREKPKFSLFD